MTLTRWSWDRVKPVWMELVIEHKEVIEKFRNPKQPQVVADCFGTTVKDLIMHAVWVVAYMEDNPPDGKQDGNYKEFCSWVGLTDQDMDVIRSLMLKHGWNPESEYWIVNLESN